jgi:hypothetical protein
MTWACGSGEAARFAGAVDATFVDGKADIDPDALDGVEGVDEVEGVYEVEGVEGVEGVEAAHPRTASTDARIAPVTPCILRR